VAGLSVVGRDRFGVFPLRYTVAVGRGIRAWLLQTGMFLPALGMELWQWSSKFKRVQAVHVFVCRGKLLNVRDASAAQITGNAEIQNIKQILGLQHGKAYSDAKSLRYGHLMIMTDQVQLCPGRRLSASLACSWVTIMLGPCCVSALGQSCTCSQHCLCS
jgi:hypothetical protein